MSTSLDDIFPRQPNLYSGMTLDELESVVEDATRISTCNPTSIHQDASQGHCFRLVRLSDLLSLPEVPIDWVLDGMLAVGTISAVVAKPKVGKSTFARGLCLAVAKGSEFLGRRTRQGPCIYLALEERVEEVTSDFRAMGADGTEPEWTSLPTRLNRVELP